MKSHFGMTDLFCSEYKQGFTTLPVRQRHENNCRKASSPSTELAAKSLTLKEDDTSTKLPAVDDALAIKEACDAGEYAKLLATFKKAELVYLDALAALSAEEAIREKAREATESMQDKGC